MGLGVFIVIAAILGGVGSTFGEEWYVSGAGGEPWDPDRAGSGDVHTDWLWPQQLSLSLNLAEGQLLDRAGKVILRGLYARGGLVYEGTAPKDSVRLVEASYMVDGDSTTAYKRKRKGMLIDLDLGARFGVNHIRFFARPRDKQEAPPLRRFGVYLCPGTPETLTPEGLPVFALFSPYDDVVADRDTVDLQFPPEDVRFVRIKVLSEVEFEIEEFQVFGEGFSPTAEYISEPIDLGERAKLGLIEWDELRTGDPLESSVQVYTRTGEDDTPMVYTRVLRKGGTYQVLGLVPWKANSKAPVSKVIQLTGEEAFNVIGEDEATGMNLDTQVPVETGLEYWRWLSDTLKTKADELALSEEEWQKLLPFDLGPHTQAGRGSARTDMEYWTSWQPVVNGTQIPSPQQRRYIQFKVVLSSRDIHSAAGVSSLRFQYSTVASARELVGEIAPAFGVEMGQEVWFTYGVKALIDSTNSGFDHLEVFTPSRVDSIGGAKAEPGEVGVLQLNGEALPCSLQVVENDRFVVRFAPISLDSETVSLRLRFRCAMLGFGAHFRGRVFQDEDGDGEPDDLPQEMFAGNAGSLGEGDADRLSVEVTFRQQALLGPLRVFPQVFTPNGDGINDEAYIAYDLFQLSRKRKVWVEVYDMNGALISTVYRSEGDGQGRYERIWDGKNAEDELVSPGVYLAQVRVRADQGIVSRMAIVTVVY